jgi:hypothetical protein
MPHSKTERPTRIRINRGGQNLCCIYTGVNRVLSILLQRGHETPRGQDIDLHVGAQEVASLYATKVKLAAQIAPKEQTSQ